MQELIDGKKWVRWKESWAGYKPTNEPLTLELEVDWSSSKEIALLEEEPKTIPRCIQCGAGDIKLRQSPKVGLVCIQCEPEVTTVTPTISVNSKSESESEDVDPRLVCSKCQRQRTSQVSTFFTRWHQCPGCDRVYCNECGGQDKEGLFFERGGRCEDCGSITELIY